LLNFAADPEMLVLAFLALSVCVYEQGEVERVCVYEQGEVVQRFFIIFFSLSKDTFF